MQELSQENKKLQEDTARMHYNMGNTFFEQGKYKRAAQEYAKVVEITPYDAAAHYNLAFVTGDFLGDYKTALEHYERYLYLHPDAEDEFFVREKIMQAQLILKTRIDSPIDK